jgi:tetratricopeptide (TPR) repeat protein
VAPRTRVLLVVAAAAVAAALATVGGTVLLSRGDETGGVGVRPGRPPLVLDLGLRADAEAAALRRAARLYRAGRVSAARRIFASSSSLQAQVGAVLASFPAGAVVELDRLARAHPRSGVVRLHLGLVLYWERRDREAVQAWRAVGRVDPDSAAAVEAGNLLHPRLPPGLPEFVPSFGPPRSISTLPPRRQVEALGRAARRRDPRAKLLYGVVLQRLGRPVSARREFAAAARLAPRDPEARVAAAVGLFDKDRPALAFSRLGPLVDVFPRAPTVRFHLGLLLFWTGRIEAGKLELERARAEGPATPLGRAAAAFLAGLARRTR